MKEDILEQVVEDYLQARGYFNTTQHKVPAPQLAQRLPKIIFWIRWKSSQLT